MASFDIFNNDAFSMQSLIQGIEDIEHSPSMVRDLKIFAEKPIRTRIASIERRGESIGLVKSSPLGSPIDQLGTTDRDLFNFRTVRLAKGDTILASELDSVRAFGSETEVMAVQSEIARRIMLLDRDIGLTSEYMMLGALQGKMLDADGSIIKDWYSEFGQTASAEINFDFANLSQGELHKKCTNLVRNMVRNSMGHINAGSSVIAFCGDNFYDDLVQNADVIERTRNASDAKVVIGGGAFESLQYGNITWVNYRGTDDNSTVSIGTDKAIFFPKGAGDMFQEILSPDESLEGVGSLGRSLYPLIVRDNDRNHWVKVEVYKYPLYICTTPKALQKGKRA